MPFDLAFLWGGQCSKTGKDSRTCATFHLWWPPKLIQRSIDKIQNTFFKIRRLQTMAIEVFKILNKQSPSYLSDLINMKMSQYNFRHRNTNIPRVNTTRYGINSFRYQAAKLWNSIPENIKSTSSYNQFCLLIKSWNGPECKCNACNK